MATVGGLHDTFSGHYACFKIITYRVCFIYCTGAFRMYYWQRMWRKILSLLAMPFLMAVCFTEHLYSIKKRLKMEKADGAQD